MSEERKDARSTTPTDNGGGRRVRERSDEDRVRAVRIVCFIVTALLFACAVACGVAFAVTRLDVLFIPIALSLAVALISFTYARIYKG